MHSVKVIFKECLRESVLVFLITRVRSNHEIVKVLPGEILEVVSKIPLLRMTLSGNLPRHPCLECSMA